MCCQPAVMSPAVIPQLKLRGAEALSSSESPLAYASPLHALASLNLLEEVSSQEGIVNNGERPFNPQLGV